MGGEDDRSTQWMWMSGNVPCERPTPVESQVSAPWLRLADREADGGAPVEDDAPSDDSRHDADDEPTYLASYVRS
jgi:hypothetical protein